MKTSPEKNIAISAGLLITFSCITANASDDPPGYFLQPPAERILVYRKLGTEGKSPGSV